MNTIKINDVEYVRADAAVPQPVTERPLTVGNAVFVRTVTHHYTGRVAEIGDDYIVLIDAAWIADDGHFSVALETGKFAEVEPYPDPVELGRGAIVDATVWRHALPRAVQ